MGYKIAIVFPREGVLVPRSQSNRMIPEKGAEVPMSPYYMRRIQEGDLLLEKDKKVEKPKKIKTTKSIETSGGE